MLVPEVHVAAIVTHVTMIIMITRIRGAIVPVGMGGIAFIVAAKLLRIKEMEQLFAMFKRRFAR